MDPVGYEDEVAHAIAASLDDIDGLQNSPYLLSNPTFPCAELLPGEVIYDRTMQRGHDDMAFIVRVSVAANLDIGSQRKLRSFRQPSGENSIKEAVEADMTLGGLVSGCRVVSMSGVRQFRRPDGTVTLGCDFTLNMMGDGSV